MNNKKYKIGDKVYTNKSSFWGMSEMEVIELMDYSVTCYNPMVGASGGFSYGDIYKVNSKKGIKHTQILKKIKNIDDKIYNLTIDKTKFLYLFKDSY